MTGEYFILKYRPQNAPTEPLLVWPEQFQTADDARDFTSVIATLMGEPIDAEIWLEIPIQGEIAHA